MTSNNNVEIKTFSSGLFNFGENALISPEEEKTIISAIVDINNLSPYSQPDSLVHEFFAHCEDKTNATGAIYTTHCIFHEKICIGFAQTRIIFETLELDYVAIAPEQRRKGFALTIMEHIITFASLYSCNEMILEVGEKNQAALSLYQKIGFETIGKRKGYYKNGEDAFVLKKQFV